MTDQGMSNIISSLAVLVAAGAAVVALVISAIDRRSARAIAQADRREAFRQAHLLFELESLTRLSANLNRGGSSNPQEVEKLGAEALMLVGVLGPERLPAQWARKVGPEERIREFFEMPDTPEWKRDAQEAQFAIAAVTEEIRSLLGTAQLDRSRTAVAT